MQNFALLLALLVAAAPQAAPTASPTTAPTTAPTASPSPTASPRTSPSPVPTTPGLPTPYPLPTATLVPPPVATPQPIYTPWPTPSPIPTPLALPDDAPPQIVDVHLDENVIHSGDMVSGWVVTSTNVASVEVRIASYSFGVPRKDSGQFAMSYKAPHIPFFARGRYVAQVIARNAKGDQAERDIQIALR
jgi:hypothetical protein